MARRKVKLAWVENNRARKSTYKKRRESLLKLMTEFTILCNVNGFVIVYAPNNNEPAMWPDRPVVEEILRRFQNVPEADRRKKMMNQEIYLKERTVKLKEKIRKHQKKNHELEMREKMHQIEKGKPFDVFETSELTSLVFFLKERMNEIKRRIDYYEDGALPPPHEGGDANQNINQIGGNTLSDGWYNPLQMDNYLYTKNGKQIENTVVGTNNNYDMSDMGELPPNTYFGSSFGVNEMELTGGNPYDGGHDFGLLNPIDHNNNINGPSCSVGTDMEQQPPHTYFGSIFNAANYINRVPTENFAGSFFGLPYGQGSQYEQINIGLPLNYGGILGGSEIALDLDPNVGDNNIGHVRYNDGMGHLPHHGHITAGDPGSDMQLPPGLFGGNNGGTGVELPYDVTKTFQSSFSP